MIIYLAGGMRDGWQELFSELLKEHELLDPRSWSDPDPAVYTARDLEAIRRCDVVLAYMSSSNPSGFGMSVEIGFAYGLGKKIVFVDHIKNDWRSQYLGMHRQMADVVCDSVFDAVKEILADA
jgi:nucleoside 2-deoxyribosyltransferase